MRPLLAFLWIPVVLLVFCALVALTGCAGTIGAPATARVGATPPSPRCTTLDDRHAFAGGVGKAAAVLSGGAGLSTLVTEDTTLRVSLAISSAVMAATAALSSYVSDQAAESFGRECR